MKNLNFIVNRICANTPPCCSKRASRFVWVLVLMLTLGVGQMWGTTYTFYDNASELPGSWTTSGGKKTINSIEWTYSSSVYISLDNSHTKIQVGSSKNPQTSAWTIQTAVSNFGSGKKITSVAITAYTTVTTATYDISVGGSSVKSGDLATASNTYTTNTLNVTSGDIVITLTGSSSSKAMYLENISVTYENAGTTHTLNEAVSPTGAGSVELGATSLVESTGQTTATATANTGYVFNYWTISGAGATMSHTTDGKSTDNPVTVTMGTDNATVTANFLQQVKTPTFSEGTGTYNNYKDITLSCETSGATIRYTTNNTEPTSTSTEYTGAITVNATGTVIRAKAFKNGMAASAEASATYTLTCATPALTTGGTFYTNQSVTINCGTTDAVVRYTTNGNDPTESSTVYNGAISVTQTTTIKAKAFKTGMNASSVASATYTLKCEAPTFSPVAGIYTGGKDVEISTTTTGAAIHYTSGTSTPSDPTASSPTYNNAIDVDCSMIIKAIATKEGWSNSDVTTAAYTIKYNVSWSVDGAAWTGKGGSTEVECGHKVSELPEAPNPKAEPKEGCGDRFMGWTDAENGEYVHGTSTLFTTAGAAPDVTGDVTYYAVFADYAPIVP